MPQITRLKQVTFLNTQYFIEIYTSLNTTKVYQEQNQFTVSKLILFHLVVMNSVLRPISVITACVCMFENIVFKTYSLHLCPVGIVDFGCIAPSDG